MTILGKTVACKCSNRCERDALFGEESKEDAAQSAQEESSAQTARSFHFLPVRVAVSRRASSASPVDRTANVLDTEVDKYAGENFGRLSCLCDRSSIATRRATSAANPHAKATPDPLS
jgi:hypothetical protein